MAATLLQTQSNGATATSVAVGPFTTSGPNNSLIAYVMCTPTGRTLTVSDNINAGNYTADSTGNATSCSAGIYSIHGIAVGSTTVTFAISGASAGMAVIVEEWSGLLIPTPADKVGANVSGGTSATTAATGTLSSAPELAVSMLALVLNSTGRAVTSPFTINGTQGQLASANYQPPTNASLQSNWTWTTSQSFSCRLVTYQLAPTSAQISPLYARKYVLFHT